MQSNVLTLARALVLLLDSDHPDAEEAVSEMQGIVGTEYNAALTQELAGMRSAKLGIQNTEANSRIIEGLWTELVGVNPPLGAPPSKEAEPGILEQAQLDYTLFFRELARATVGEMPSPSDAELLAVVQRCSYDPACLSLCDGGTVTSTPPSTAGPSTTSSLHSAAGNASAVSVAADMLEWLKLWREHAVAPDAADTMRQANPKYIAREWILAEAYTAAELGDFSLVHELQRVFASPYDEHSAEIEAKYYQLTPEHMKGQFEGAFNAPCLHSYPAPTTAHIDRSVRECECECECAGGREEWGEGGRSRERGAARGERRETGSQFGNSSRVYAPCLIYADNVVP